MGGWVVRTRLFRADTWAGRSPPPSPNWHGPVVHMSLIFGSFFWRSAPIDPLVPPSVPPPCMHLYLVTPTLGRRTVLPGCRSVLPGAGGHCACHACSLAQLQPDLMRGDRRRDVRHPKVDPSGCKVLRQQRRPWWRRLGCDRRVRPCSAFAWGFPPPSFSLGPRSFKLQPLGSL